MMNDVCDENDDIFDEKNLIDEKIDKVNRCFDICGLQRLTKIDISFLLEYCKVRSIKNKIFSNKFRVSQN